MDNEKLIKKTKKLLLKWGVTDAEADEFIKDLANASDEDDIEEEDVKEVTTKEEIGEAKQDIAEKGKDTQTEKDRIDESVAAQEKDTDTEDSQDAKARVDESEGVEEESDKPTEPADEPPVEPETPPVESVTMEAFNDLVKRVEELEKTNGKTVKEVEPKEASELDKAIAQYSN